MILIKKTHINNIRFGDILEQNTFRHDSLLAIPKGTVIKDREIQYLKDLKLQYVYITREKAKEKTTEDEILNIIEETILKCTLWNESIGKKIYSRIKRLLKKNKKLLHLFALMNTVDHYSFVASLNIALIVGKTLFKKNKIDKDVIELMFYALIHDVGKIKVSNITTKDGSLSETEFYVVRQHPKYSYQILEDFGFPEKKISYVLQTHERYDGAGYPEGLEGEEIEPLAQIIAVAEMYNALSSFRPHRPAFHPIEVTNKIRDEENRAFGKQYVDIFVNNFSPYRVGSTVEMSNGYYAKIIKVYEKRPLFPTVELYSPKTGKPLHEVNLFRNQELRISRVIV